MYEQWYAPKILTYKSKHYPTIIMALEISSNIPNYVQPRLNTKPNSVLQLR